MQIDLKVLLAVIAMLEGGSYEWNKDVYGPHQISYEVAQDYVLVHDKAHEHIDKRSAMIWLEANYHAVAMWHINRLSMLYAYATWSEEERVKAILAAWRSGVSGQAQGRGKEYAERGWNLYVEETRKSRQTAREKK